MVTACTSTGHHVLVGGLGSLGRVLQKILLDSGKKIRVVDILPPAMAAKHGGLIDPSVEYHQCRPGPQSPAKYVSSSFLDRDAVYNKEVLDSLKRGLDNAESVYSLATGHVTNGTAADVYQANDSGIRHLLEACKQVGVPKLIHASSMAVTNQLLGYHNANEIDTTPLPPWDTFLIPYDISKRRGEELVLSANDDSDSITQTCALRLSSILAGPTDYCSTGVLQMRESIGSILGFDSAPCDYISAYDISRAMLKASGKLDSENSTIGGKAMYLTKSRKDDSSGVGDPSNGYSMEQTMKVYADKLGCKYTHIPTVVIKGVAQGASAVAFVRNMLSPPKDDQVAALPLHLLLRSIDSPMTFDDSLARDLMDYEPEDSLDDIITRICNQIHSRETFSYV